MVVDPHKIGSLLFSRKNIYKSHLHAFLLGGGASQLPAVSFSGGIVCYMCHGQKSLYWGWSSHL